ncbi:MAG: hypothetical protein RLZZ450_6183, partial [Pseudomonadota bacterium]
MRATAAASLVLLLGCSSSEPDREQVGSKAQVEACSVAAASQFFRDVTQVDYDYRALSATALMQRSSLVVSAHLESVAEGLPDPPADNPLPTTLATFRVDYVYKGTGDHGGTVRIHLPRAPVVTPDALRSANSKVPGESVTLFLTEDTLHPGSNTLRLTTPQGLIVASACGTDQALDAATTFDPPVNTELELDSAIRNAVPDTEGECSATAKAKLLWRATQVLYDYTALSPTQLVERSHQVVRGRVESLTAGSPRSAVLSVTVDKVYKGPAKDGDQLLVSLSKSEAVTERDLEDLGSRLRDASVTLFVYEDDDVSDQPGRRNWPTSPQGLIVAAACGVQPALTRENPFGEAVNSDAALGARRAFALGLLFQRGRDAYRGGGSLGSRGWCARDADGGS